MRRRRRRRRAGPGLATLALAATAGAPPAAGVGGDPAQPGSYCLLPDRPGGERRCLAPARQRYGELFESLEEGGAPPPEASQEVERELETGGPGAVLALSSLSYAYWRIALRAAETEEMDPALADRLEEWNRVLATAYERHRHEPELRHEIHTAAADLEARAPESVEPARGLLGRLDDVDGRLGLRGAIRRVLERVFGGDDAG